MLVWPQGARELVDTLDVARLATVDADGQPHVVPICFVVTGDTLYSVVDAKPKRRPRSLKRFENVALNPRATVLLDRYAADWTQLAWAMLAGLAATVADDAEYARAVALLSAKYPQYRNVRFARDVNPMLALHVERVRFWSYASSAAS